MVRQSLFSGFWVVVRSSHFAKNGLKISTFFQFKVEKCHFRSDFGCFWIEARGKSMWKKWPFLGPILTVWADFARKWHFCAWKSRKMAIFGCFWPNFSKKMVTSRSQKHWFSQKHGFGGQLNFFCKKRKKVKNRIFSLRIQNGTFALLDTGAVEIWKGKFWLIFEKYGWLGAYIWGRFKVPGQIWGS